jgi:hypothetical protein
MGGLKRRSKRRDEDSRTCMCRESKSRSGLMLVVRWSPLNVEIIFRRVVNRDAFCPQVSSLSAYSTGHLRLLGSKCSNDQECLADVTYSRCQTGRCSCLPYYAEYNKTMCVQCECPATISADLNYVPSSTPLLAYPYFSRLSRISPSS